MKNFSLEVLNAVVIMAVILVGLSAGTLQGWAQAPVTFDLTDQPGSWFKNIAGGIGGTESLAVVTPDTRISFTGSGTHTVHTITSLVWPTGAVGMPFDGQLGSSVVLSTPGLYVFFCKIHPYMFAAVIVDDPVTTGLDLGEEITLANGITVPTTADLATRLVRIFFIATNPSNWQDFTSKNPWHVTYPDVDVRVTGGAVFNLPALMDQRYGNDIVLPPPFNPTTPGVGEVWVDTQFELTSGKDRPGTASNVNATSWQVQRKVSLPQINMNNPHNMWTDRQQQVIYQTQWFDNKLTVFNRTTGKLINNVTVGAAPAHVMTRVDNDDVHVTLNGKSLNNSVAALSPGARTSKGFVDIGRGNPHAHWMSHDGRTMVTPNAFTADSSIFRFPTNSLLGIVPTGTQPIATGMAPDSSKYYVANFLDSTLTNIRTRTGTVTNTINLIANYDPITGNISGPAGGLPIQTPVSPNGKYMVTANTLLSTITVTDPSTDTLVAALPCDPGCHGVQFGAKKGGGYYAYVSNKFSNTLLVVDPDPNNDGNAADASVVGRIVLTGDANTKKDDTITGNFGMGGQGILPVPVVYNGWVQNLPAIWKQQLTECQIHPLAPSCQAGAAKAESHRGSLPSH
jgi:DNA-binding beta-propeller fold protein YncE